MSKGLIDWSIRHMLWSYVLYIVLYLILFDYICICITCIYMYYIAGHKKHTPLKTTCYNRSSIARNETNCWAGDEKLDFWVWLRPKNPEIFWTSNMELPKLGPRCPWKLNKLIDLIVTFGFVWKLSCTPLYKKWFCWSLSRHEQWLAIIGNINPTFSDIPI